MEFLSNVFWYTVPFIVILSILIFVHEYGHYIIARWCGVKIEEFSLGFGKKLASKIDKHGTVWKICAVPFGGYVKMFGDSDGASTPDNAKLKKMTKAQKAVAFQYKKLYQRFAIVFAGPAFNYIFAVFCFAVLFMAYGEQSTKPIVSDMKADSPAVEAGLQVGDDIISFNGQNIEKFEDVQRIASLNFEKEMPIVVKRNNEKISLKITPDLKESKNRFGEVSKRGMIGIYSNEVEFIRHSNPLVATEHAFKYSNQIITGTLQALGQMIMGTRSGDELGGPLKIAKLSKDFATQGFAAFLFFIGLLSVNLCLINLFPIPVLDGGHLLFYIIEALIRRPVPEKAQEICFKAGFYIIIAFAIFVTFNDVKSFVK